MQLYFLCTGNSCRSQMAEGLAKALLPPTWRIQSAGVEVHGLNPQAVFAMAARGLDISRAQSKLIDPDYLATSDVVITLCGDARDRCPALAPGTHALHWPLPDPAQATGSAAERAVVFATVRDQIEVLIRATWPQEVQA
ncbi:arsenate reductase (thioredoxin) [Lacticaseibacillus parakribbianus]|uniref:arsenate reductase (thioredoxin) n=1 Tax=Lacticaseibacillus parakribbianus TaxID=2970927 RepID=UPI0021CB38B5|nr:arsenate reductase (thioredoxin) [Lacticaseibacillus parakribbianus]